MSTFLGLDRWIAKACKYVSLQSTVGSHANLLTLLACTKVANATVSNNLRGSKMAPSHEAVEPPRVLGVEKSGGG